ncbi:MAG: NADH:ubiquinone reductase (Na(+)-transporting) subunit B [Planctomycetes bacterium]|nr:NADH:ubiquinone reductase (Na(+)-transporting) subunit B [Planctomycetota bacterium]
MNFLRKIVDSGRKLYHEPGSKFHKLWPMFDAAETFLFAPSTTAPKNGPHVRDYIDLKRTMTMVIYALLPCLVWSIYNTGWQHFHALATNAEAAKALTSDGYTAGWLQGLLFGSAYAPNVAAPSLMDIVVFGLDQMLPILFVSYFVGLNIEALFSVLRKEEVSEGYLVSGMLIALIVPPSIPLWQLAIAVAFSVVLCKEVFGGTGMNIFNVAMMARAFLFFAYAGQMSGDKVWVAGNGAGNLIDGYSSPTALAAAANAELTSNTLAPVAGHHVESAAAAIQQAGYSWSDLFFGFVPGSAGETSAFCILIGAAILILTGIGSWRTMLAGVLGLAATTLLIQGLHGTEDGIFGLPIQYHLVCGGFLFGLVFMATDPVTCPETDRGKWIYGFLIGALTVLVRCVNPAYPEGMMLAVLLMNAFAPTIDHFVVQANIRRRKARLG